MLNRNDDQNEAKRMVLFCIAAASMVLLLFLVALYSHDSKNTSKHVAKKENQIKNEEPEIEIGKSNIVSSDLDFWDMYDKRKTYVDDAYEDDFDDTPVRNTTKLNSSIKERKSSSSSSSLDDLDGNDSMYTSKTKDESDLDDDKHIKVIGADGMPAFYEILDTVKKNKYVFNNNLIYDNGLLKYSSSDIKSLEGIDISSYQGNIDFTKVKDAGIDFVIIKVASRGYESGQINIDNRFVDYANGAVAAGLPIGVYISSQAITDVEAVEEANYAVAASNGYDIRYPVVIDLTNATSGKSRTDRLTSSERSDIVKKFCETVEVYGRKPAIRASKDFLITKLDLEKLKGYDIWLEDEAALPDYIKMLYVKDNDLEDEDSLSSDSSSNSNLKSSSSSSSDSSSRSSSQTNKISSSAYNKDESDEQFDYIGTNYPYDFTMWQYSEKGTINGIEGSVNMNISFVNYAER
ncbi:MAG: GH25 family lysozyme [Lachnospiraceae bacterium]|nr:GH25 family lysozyme [Lachnospiraceae bacterium]